MNAKVPLPSTARRLPGLVVIALGVSLVVVDATVANVIVAPVVEDLGISSTQVQWVQESYAIVFAALLLLAGRLTDAVGARRVFLAGVALFGVTSVSAGVAPDGTSLILARALQGAGAAMILPASLALLNAGSTGRERGRAFAVWGSTIGAASALGPLLGGWLAEHASWRWVFAVNVPATALLCVGALVCLRPSSAKGGRFDAAGSVLSVAGLGLLAFGLVDGRVYGWVLSVRPLHVAGFVWDGGPSPVLVALVLAAAALPAFVRRQVTLVRRGDAERALMDVRLFSRASFRGGNIVTAVIGMGEFGVIAVLPMWLQFALGYSALEAGLALVPLAAGSFVASGASFGAAAVTPLRQVRAGLVLEAAGLAALGGVASPDSPWWAVAPVLFLYGTGVGFATAQVTNVALADVPGADAGQGSGVQSAFRQLGSALGIALLTTVFFSVLRAGLHDRLLGTGLPAGEVHVLTRAITDSAGAAIEPLAAQSSSAAAADAAKAAMTQAMTYSAFAASAFVLLGLAATAFVPARAGSASEPSGTERRALRS
ncbi:DHA2 family efflux MFS transporter permease subunit [Streptomyces caatingaensis]|uniref:Multidrug transporter n=1 Tax=Streptomyces caatingaensis TaxID=1678637 RepID=A0A0K9XC68_9ACTN|nr:DHA2 family efflux MFS transporter permease subunit [Streptomyces caatingaensis]KNB50691.1 multidrug transporter [Streptomyces caatingaensis]